MAGNQGILGWSQPAPIPVVVQRRSSLPTNGATAAGNGSTWVRFSTPWQVTITNVGAGQRVLLRVTAALTNASNYGYVAFHRVTGGVAFLAQAGEDMNGHVKVISLQYDDLTPGIGDITYEVYGGGNTGTITLRRNGSSSFSLDAGDGLLVAELYNPPTT